MNSSKARCLTKKELREMYKDDPQTLFILGVDIVPNNDDDEIVYLDTEEFVDPFDEEGADEEMDELDALLKEFGY